MIAVYCSFCCWVNIDECFLQTLNLASSLLFTPFRMEKKKKRKGAIIQTALSFTECIHLYMIYVGCVTCIILQLQYAHLLVRSALYDLESC